MRLSNLLIVLLIALLCLSGCERRTSVSIENGTPPRFIVSGPGTLNYFDVLGPDLEREFNNRQGDRRDSLPILKVYWKLVPSGKETTPRLDQIRTIVYGQVPPGLTQVYPEHGPPLPLVEYHLYNVAVVPTNADSVNKFFSIRNGNVFAEGEGR